MWTTPSRTRCSRTAPSAAAGCSQKGATLKAKTLSKRRSPRAASSSATARSTALPASTCSRFLRVAISIILGERSIAVIVPVVSRSQTRETATPWPLQRQITSCIRRCRRTARSTAGPVARPVRTAALAGALAAGRQPQLASQRQRRQDHLMTARRTLAIVVAALLCGLADVLLILGSDHFPDAGVWAVFGPLIGWSFVGT